MKRKLIILLILTFVCSSVFAGHGNMSSNKPDWTLQSEGAELPVHGDDYQEVSVYASVLSEQKNTLFAKTSPSDRSFGIKVAYNRTFGNNFMIGANLIANLAAFYPEDCENYSCMLFANAGLTVGDIIRVALKAGVGGFVSYANDFIKIQPALDFEAVGSLYLSEKVMLNAGGEFTITDKIEGTSVPQLNAFIWFGVSYLF